MEYVKLPDSHSLDHKINLLKLARGLFYLEEKRSEGLLVGPEFDMSSFENEFEDRHCRSIACAVGYGPIFVGSRAGNESWFEYSHRMFGLSGSQCGVAEDIVKCSYFWHWCFSQRWAHIDNTARGAAQRILWMLKHGLEWNDIWLTPPTWDSVRELIVDMYRFVDMYSGMHPDDCEVEEVTVEMNTNIKYPVIFAWTSGGKEIVAVVECHVDNPDKELAWSGRTPP